MPAQLTSHHGAIALEDHDADKQALKNAIIRDDGRVIKDRDAIEWATNAGSLRLWGSGAYARMDRADAVRMGYELGDAAPRVAAVGTIAGDTVAYSTGEKHPTLGLNVWQFDTLVVR